MRLRFLCQHHRALLESDASRARGTWIMSYDKALALSAEEQLEQAINAAGSALEADEILIRDHAQQGEMDLRRFTESAILLRSLLQQLGDAALVSGLVGGCMARLDWAMACGAPRRAVLQCCQRLLEAGEQVERPAVATPAVLATLPQRHSGSSAVH